MLKNNLLRISMQFFANDGASGSTSDTGVDTNGTSADTGTSNDTQTDSKGNDTLDIEKLVQARADKLTAESGKKIANLQKELEKLKKEKMTADELKNLELSEKEQALAEREKSLLDKENRLIAIKAIKAANLDDGSENALELVDFVMADTEEAITEKVKTFEALVNKFVSAQVDKTFKQNGRNPNGSTSNKADGKNGDTTVAEQLGKVRAEQQKHSREILDKFTRR